MVIFFISMIVFWLDKDLTKQYKIRIDTMKNIILAAAVAQGLLKTALFRALKLLEETGRIFKVSDKRGFYAPAKNVDFSILEV